MKKIAFPIVLVSFSMLFATCGQTPIPPLLSVTPVDISTVVGFNAFGEENPPGEYRATISYDTASPDVQVRSGISGSVKDVRVRYND